MVYFTGLLSLLLLFLLSLILTAAGIKIIKTINLSFDSDLEKNIFGFASGLILTTTFIKILGIIGLINKYIIFFYLIVLIVYAYKEIINLLKEILNPKNIFDNIFNNITDTEEKYNLIYYLFILSIIYIISLIIFNFSPPLGADSLNYQLTIPDQYLKNGGFKYMPWIFHSNYVPLEIHMLYIVCLAVQGGILVKYFSFLFVLLYSLNVYIISSKFIDKKYAFLAFLLILNTSISDYCATIITSEAPQAFFITLFFISFLRFLLKNDIKYLYISSLLIGYNCSIKQLGFLLLITAIPVIIWKLYVDYRKTFLKKISISIMLIFVFGSFWYIKNFIETGNPFFPFIWGGKYQRNFIQHLGLSNNTFVNIFHYLKSYFLFEKTGTSIMYNPVLIAVLPFFFFKFWRTKFDIIIKILFILSLIFCYELSWSNTRYWYPFFWLYVLIIIKVLKYLKCNHSLNYKIILVIQIIFTICLITFRVGMTVSYLRYSTEEDFYNAKIDGYPAIKYLNTKIDQKKKVLAFCFSHFLIKYPNTIFCDFQQGYVKYSHLKKELNPKKLYNRIKELKIDIVYIKYSSKNKYPLKNTLCALQDMKLLELIYNTKYAGIYKVK